MMDPRFGMPQAEAAGITLAEARELALRNNKEIAVLGYTPQVVATNIDAECGVFDPVIGMRTGGGIYNRQVSTLIQSQGALVPVLKQDFFGGLADEGPNQFFVGQRLGSGGRYELGMGSNYLNYNPQGDFVFINPAWNSTTNLIIEQPLFRGAGRRVNRAPVQIARANETQSTFAFRSSVSVVLRDVEAAYWNVYAAYRDLEAREKAVDQASVTLDRERERLRVGEGSVPDVSQAEEQFETYQIARADALNRVVTAERVLRQLIGLPIDDRRPLRPITEPVVEVAEVSWDEGLAGSQQRPELAAQRAAIEAAQIDYARMQNGLAPDVALRFNHSMSGLSNRWGASLQTLGTGAFNDVTAGVVYRQALGRRVDQANARRAALTVSREIARYREIEHVIMHELEGAYQDVLARQQLLEMHRRRREAARIQLEARKALYNERRATLLEQLDAESRFASAILDEGLAVVAYQHALVRWNFARGATLGDAVVFVEEPPPPEVRPWLHLPHGIMPSAPLPAPTFVN